jgi:hypothetical protein
MTLAETGRCPQVNHSFQITECLRRGAADNDWRGERGNELRPEVETCGAADKGAIAEAWGRGSSPWGKCVYLTIPESLGVSLRSARLG